MTNHPLKYATIVPAGEPLGERTFAAARKQIEGKHGVVPEEIFLDTVQVEGIVIGGDIRFDLDALNARYLVFGADYPPAADLATPRDLADLVNVDVDLH